MTETYYPVTGGGETQARALAEGLQAAGIGVQLVTRRSDAAFPPQETVGGVHLNRVGPSGSGQLRKWGLIFTAFVKLIRLRREFDVILVCGFRILAIPALLADLFIGRPCVLKADSQGELSGAFFDPGLHRLKLRHDRFPASTFIRARNVLFRRAARFVAISAVIEQEYLALGVQPGRIARIPNSVDLSRFRPASGEERNRLRRRFGIAAGRPVAIFTGRLVTTKGLPSLLRAWPAVLERHPEALLVLVGSGGLGLQNCESMLRHQAKEKHLAGSVLFTGSVDNVEEYLQAGDIFVFPTEREAFGISIIEAMACGLPVVTTGVDGIRDIVRAGKDALLVGAGDDASLAAAISSAFDGGCRIQAIAEAARERVTQHYSSHRIVAAYGELLAEVLHER
jgi:glycosyltransferase involved in cell wall biosynthesis